MKYDYSRLPAELKALGPAYGLYRKKGLTPLSAGEYLIGNRVPLKVDDPGTWSDFDDSVRAYMNDKTGEIHGVACILQARHNLVCFDFDKPKDEAEFNKRKIPNLTYTDYCAMHMADVQDFVTELNKGTFVERSRSSQGYHAFFNGALPPELGGYNGRFILGDVFSRNQAIFLTADCPPHWKQTLAGQKGVEYVLSQISDSLQVFDAREEWLGTKAENTTEHGRQLGLSDDVVLATYFARNKEHIELYNGSRVNYTNGEDNWSTGTNLLQKELDKITGDPDQIYRIMFASPRLMNAGKAGNGVDRMRRTDKFFDKYLATARVKNNAWFTQHGNHYADRQGEIARGQDMFARMGGGLQATAAAPAPVATPVIPVTGTIDERMLAAGAQEEINEEGEPYWVIVQDGKRTYIGKTPAQLEAWLAAQAPLPPTTTPQPAQAAAAQPQGVQSSYVGPGAPPPKLAEVTKAGRFSPTAVKALKNIMGDLPGQYMKFSEPPGLLGEACRMCAKGMYEPLPYLAVPATIVAMSGIVSQAYKYHGYGLNVMFVAGAKTGVGKTQAADVWHDYIDEILQTDDTFINAKNRMAPFNIGSRVGAHSLLQKRSAFAWFNDECEPLLNMLEGVDPRAIAVQNLVLKMFEISKDSTKWEPEESRTGQNMRDRVLRNVSIASFWATTITTLRQYLQPEFLSKGFGSRLLFLLYRGASGMEQQPRNILRQLPEGDLRRTLKQLLRTSNEVEALYQSFPKWYMEKSAEERKLEPMPEQQSHKEVLIHVFEDEAAAEFLKGMRERIGNFKRGVQLETDDYPEYYSMLSRIAMIAPRIAGIMAVMENPTNPMITLPQAQYAYGYCFQIMGETISAFDTNELGVALNQGDTVVVNAVKQLIQKNPKYLESGVPSWALNKLLKMRAPFSRPTCRDTPDMAVMRIAGHGLVEVKGDTHIAGARGRPGKTVHITSHHEWDDLFK